LCKSCGSCVENCFTNALVLGGKRMSVEQVMEEVVRDKPFYDNSGGGVTLSGGEPLLQLEFSCSILKACRKEGISTAVETSGHARWQDIAGLLPLLDLVMMDLKHMDPEKHRWGTGVSNKLILANARRLVETDKPIIFRVLVIPTVNDTTAEIKAIANFVDSLLCRRVENSPGGGIPSQGISLELLAYHPLAGDKYRSLGKENQAKSLEPLSQKKIREFQNMVKTIISRSEKT